MTKYYRTFSLLVSSDHSWDLCFSEIDPNGCSITITELHSPNLNLNLVPLPGVCRSVRRSSPEKDEILFLSFEPIRGAK